MHIVYVYSKTSVDFVTSRKAELGCELVGSWTVSVGDMDQALHLWRYVGGFEKIDKAKILFKENPVSYFILIFFNCNCYPFLLTFFIQAN